MEEISTVTVEDATPRRPKTVTIASTSRRVVNAVGVDSHTVRIPPRGGIDLKPSQVSADMKRLVRAGHLKLS